MWAGQKVYQYDEIGSTNTEAKRLGEAGAPHGTLVVANRQTAGRGRRGRTWESVKEGNLYFSLLLKPKFSIEKASMLTLVMALATLEAGEEICGIRLGIKWPNDIVVQGKKAVGILTELNLLSGGGYQVIIGVGINVARQKFSEDIAAKAISLEEAKGKEISKEDLLENVLKHFEDLYEQFCRDGNLSGLKAAYNSRLVNKNQVVKVLEPTGQYRGMALGINEEGELLVAPCGENDLPDMENVQRVYAGEVSVRGIYGYV